MIRNTCPSFSQNLHYNISWRVQYLGIISLAGVGYSCTSKIRLQKVCTTHINLPTEMSLFPLLPQTQTQISNTHTAYSF